MSTLNADQRRAVELDHPRILCKAAPGAGKTRTLVERVVRLITTGWHPSEVLALTFTRAAAEEMRTRVVARLEEIADERGKVEGQYPSWCAARLTLRTFHSWAALLLRQYADRLGVVREFTIYDDADREDVIKFVGLELAAKFKSARRLWEETSVRDRYWRLLREAGAFDYDMLEKTLTALIGQDMMVRRQLQARWKHVLVDEGQDTSLGQQRTLDLLCPDNLFVVGDPGQSIYSFRGAHPEGFLALAERAGWITVQLQTNYRSHAPIVDAATRLGQAMESPGLDQVAGRDDPVWELELAECSGPTSDAVLDAVVDHLQGCAFPEDAEDQGLPAGGRTSPWSWRDMAVLSPQWKFLDELALRLEAAGIPHVVARREVEVWDDPAARWAINCLRVAVNPQDHLSLWRAINAFQPRMGLRRWAQLRAAAMQAGWSVPEQIGEESSPEDYGESLGALYVAMAAARVRVVNGEGVALAIWEIGPTLRLLLEQLHLNTRVEWLDRFGMAVGEWTAEAEDPSAQAFLDWYAARSIQDALAKDDEDRVTLLSCHGSKGLEWPCVWMLACEPGVMPRSSKAGPGLEESRRLFYVATTRARDRLRWCWSEDRGRSPFIGEALGGTRRQQEAV